MTNGGGKKYEFTSTIRIYFPRNSNKVPTAKNWKTEFLVTNVLDIES